MGKFLSSWANISFSRGTILHGASMSLHELYKINTWRKYHVCLTVHLYISCPQLLNIFKMKFVLKKSTQANPSLCLCSTPWRRMMEGKFRDFLTLISVTKNSFGTHFVRDLLGPRAGLHALSKINKTCPCWGSNLDRPARVKSRYWQRHLSPSGYCGCKNLLVELHLRTQVSDKSETTGDSIFKSKEWDQSPPKKKSTPNFVMAVWRCQYYLRFLNCGILCRMILDFH
jgi:hypothetical protein